MVRYLEIGSYIGMSASLMLEHPYPTNVTMIDPMVLKSSHWNGRVGETQLEAIKRNVLEKYKNVHLHKMYSTDLRVKSLFIPSYFDLILIDGDHTTHGVLNDFQVASKLIKPNGYISFDGYNDQHKHSSQVKPTVDKLTKWLMWEGGVSKMYPNEYVVHNVPPTRSRLCVQSLTYKRKDGSTPHIFARHLDQLSKQTDQDFVTYIIGDNYSDTAEFESLFASYGGKYVANNYANHQKRTWANMAAEAVRLSSPVMWKQCDYILAKDDDDTWEPTHVENMHKYINMYPLAGFITSKARYMKPTFYLPRTKKMKIYLNNYVSTPGDSVRSSHVYKSGVHKKAFEIASNGNVKTPHDMRMLAAMRDMKVPVLYIPIHTVTKLTEHNTPS